MNTTKKQAQYSIWEVVGNAASPVSGTYIDLALACQRSRELTARLKRNHVAVEVGGSYEQQLKKLTYRNN
jgi:exonuclease III